MVPEARRLRILDQINREGHLAVADLAAAFGVSEMTIHRDLGLLEQDGMLRKVFGGAVALYDSTKQTEAHPSAGLICSICNGNADSRTRFTIHYSDAQPTYACCAHCGLLSMSSVGERPISAMTPDFISGRTLNALEATYVVGSKAAPCCSPSVLCFGDYNTGARFKRGFGGEPFDIWNARTKVHEMMGGPHISN